MKMKYKLAGILVAAIVALAALWWLVSGISQSEVTLDVNQEIDLTPEQITSIEAIGELPARDFSRTIISYASTTERCAWAST